MSHEHPATVASKAPVIVSQWLVSNTSIGLSSPSAKEFLSNEMPQPLGPLPYSIQLGALMTIKGARVLFLCSVGRH